MREKALTQCARFGRKVCQGSVASQLGMIYRETLRLSSPFVEVRAQAIDPLHLLGIRDGDLVSADANDWAVMCVSSSQLNVVRAGDDGSGFPDVRDGSQAGPRNVSERVEEKVVDDAEHSRCCETGEDGGERAIVAQ